VASYVNFMSEFQKDPIHKDWHGIAARPISDVLRAPHPSEGYPLDKYLIGVRCGMTSGGQAAPVTLGYPEIGHQLRELRYMVLHAGPTGPHRSPTTSRHGGRSPQEPHGLNGTLRYTYYTC
jgi:hypothetical protein